MVIAVVYFVVTVTLEYFGQHFNVFLLSRETASVYYVIHNGFHIFVVALTHFFTMVLTHELHHHLALLIQILNTYSTSTARDSDRRTEGRSPINSQRSQILE
jgi:hypothetical protein